VERLRYLSEAARDDITVEIATTRAELHAMDPTKVEEMEALLARLKATKARLVRFLRHTEMLIADAKWDNARSDEAAAEMHAAILNREQTRDQLLATAARLALKLPERRSMVRS
jgi:hypothetical protein